MTVIETSIIDEEDDDYVAGLLVAMKKDETKAVNSTSEAAAMSTAVPDRFSYPRSAPSRSCAARLQFFVRMISNTVVMHACPQESVRSIHERIEMMTGIPIMEQCLIYRGKQLRWEQTLYECAIESDANIQMVGRMRSTMHPQGWQVIDDMVSLIVRLCRGETVHDSLKIIEGLMISYLNPTRTKIVNLVKNDDECVTSYFNIFLSSNAPAVLVMLYVSSSEGNKELADCSIRHFLISCRTVVHKAWEGQCARLVMELCKVLKRVGCECGDPLYMLSRNTLASLLETASVSYCSVNDKGNFLLQDISPFVRELADKLLRDLDLSLVAPLCVGPRMNDVRDFTVFLIPLRKGIKELQTLKCSSGIKELQTLKGSIIDDEKLCEELSRAAEEANNLHLIFFQLLSKMGECLHSMEELLANKKIGGRDFVSLPWSQYLSILKELHQITKLYDGAEEMFWEVLMQRRHIVCLLIVEFAKRTDDHHWILDHKAVTDFESRRRLAMMLLPDVREDYEELHEMLIDRSQLLAESFNYIKHAEPKSLHAGLYMEFKDEEATGPGVLREWFFFGLSSNI